MESIMKPKAQRQYYAKKQLKRSDPRAVCRAFSWTNIHVPAHLINAEHRFETHEVHITSECINCHLTIETSVPELTWTTADSVYSVLRDSRWHTWQYIIEEEPY